MGRSVFTNARVFDGTALCEAGTTVVVEGHRITQVTTAPVESGADDVVHDLAGKTLMPGMVQCHFHSGFGPDAGNASPYLNQSMPPAYLGMVAAKNAQIAIDCGVTSMIGSSNGDLLDVCLKEAILLGQTRGPRVIPCTHEFMSSGNEADGDNRSWYMGIEHKGLTRRVDGVDQMRQAVREELGRGCQIVKLAGFADRHATDGVAGKVERQQLGGAPLAQLANRPALHDTEEDARTVVGLPRTPRPRRTAIDGRGHLVARGGQRRTLVEHHRDVRPQGGLDLHALLGAQEMQRAVDVRTEPHALVVDRPHARQGEHLEPAGIGEDRPGPVHESVQPAQFGHHVVPRTEVEVIRVAQDHLSAAPGDLLGRDSLDRAGRADGHERRRLHVAPRGRQAPDPRGAVPTEQFETEGPAHESPTSNIASPYE